MGTVEDLWWTSREGGRVPRARSGRGLLWRARYRDAEGRQRSRSFARKPDAVRFLALVQADLLRGTYIDPGRSRTWPCVSAVWRGVGVMTRVRAPGEPWYTALYREPLRLWWLPAVLFFAATLTVRRFMEDEDRRISLLVSGFGGLVFLLLAGRRHRNRKEDQRPSPHRR